MTAGRLAAAVLAALAVAGADGQFRSGVDAVRVDVLVQAGGRPVTGLTAADFELLDNGVPQRIDAVGVDDVPLSVMVVLDTSDSVAGDPLRSLRLAADGALSSLRPIDRAALITFASDLRLVAAWSGDLAAARAGLETVRAGGGTSLFDAAFASLALRDASPNRRHLLILFSDGADTMSWLPESAVLRKAERTDTVAYAAVLGRPGPPAGHVLMRRSGVRLSEDDSENVFDTFPKLLTAATGGQSFAARSPGDLRDVFTRIVAEFRSRYLLTYMPTGVDPSGWHEIEVQVKRRGAAVRARRGYHR